MTDEALLSKFEEFASYMAEENEQQAFKEAIEFAVDNNLYIPPEDYEKYVQLAKRGDTE